MSSSYNPQVGDIVIPSRGQFKDLKCRVIVITEDYIGVECLESGADGHTLDGRLSQENGYWYIASCLKYEGKDNSTNSTNSKFKVGDRVSSPSYLERGPGTVRESDCETLILVEHDDIFENSHDGDGACFPGTSWYYDESEIQIVHEVKPKPEPEPELKPEFKVGDVVETKLNSIKGPGVILKIQPSGVYAVEHFKKGYGHHSCTGLGKDGHCWNYREDEIILSSATKPEPEELKPDKPQEIKSLHGYSLGDRVKGRYGPGTVVHFSEAGSIGVEHDKHNGSHSCGGHGRSGYCWYFKSGEIEKLEPISLTSTGIEVTGITGITGMTGGITGPIISSSADSSILADFDAYLKTSYIHNADSGGWIGMSGTIAGSKKPKSSVDKYIQDPIISKKTKKKKSLVIV